MSCIPCEKGLRAFFFVTDTKVVIPYSRGHFYEFTENVNYTKRTLAGGLSSAAMRRDPPVRGSLTVALVELLFRSGLNRSCGSFSVFGNEYYLVTFIYNSFQSVIFSFISSLRLRNARPAKWHSRNCGVNNAQR